MLDDGTWMVYWQFDTEIYDKEDTIAMKCPHCRMEITGKVPTYAYKTQRYHIPCFLVVVRKREPPEKAEELIRQAMKVLSHAGKEVS